MEWEKAIYSNIHSSDVVIVLLEKETHLSDWVQREVDVARGANISILPLAIDKGVNLQDVITRLALENTQYFASFRGTDEDFDKLRVNIDRLSKETRDAQKSWIRELELRWRVRPAPLNLCHRVYRLRGGKSRHKVIIATGDMTEMPDIDVLVNSENDYMQMARIHESETLSSAMRRKGSYMLGGRIYEDTIQLELDEQIKHSPDHGNRPIPIQQVVVTSAGHPQSELVKKGARYIFHAATVRVHENEYHMQPLMTDSSIQSATLNCLNKVIDVDEKNGEIWYKQRTQSAEVYQPIRSIIFPLFGTGHGGRPVSEVAPPMIQAFHDFLHSHQQNPSLKLETIYLCVYSSSDIAEIEDCMLEHFEPVYA